jgi:hypothetical protein
MNNEREKNNKNSDKAYLGVVLLFTAAQTMIGSFQLIQSSLNSTVVSAKYFGFAGALFLPLVMWYMFKIIIKDSK